MNGLLLLTVGLFLQVFLVPCIFYIRDRRAKKRFKEESVNLDEGVVELDERVVERVMSVSETQELYGIISGTTNEWETSYNRDYFIPLREDTLYNILFPSTQKDFLPKKKMKYHTLEEMGPLTKSGRPDMRYSANRGDRGDIADDFMEDEESGPATVCDNCYDTTDYEYPF